MEKVSMKVKTRSIASINNWGIGRCKGKIKGIQKRVNYVAQSIIILDELNKLSDDILISLFEIAIKLLNEERKIFFRILFLKGHLNFKVDDLYFHNYPYIYDWCFNAKYIHNTNIYNRYKELKAKK